MSASATELGLAHRFVPGRGAASEPTLLLLHGTGGNENDLLPLGRAVAPDAALLAPRAKVLENDAGHVIAVGFSNGANIAASTLLFRPRALAGAVLFRPMVPLVSEALPDLVGVPVLISAGRLDPIARPEQIRALASMLSDASAGVTVRWHEAAHTITEDDVAARVHHVLCENGGELAAAIACSTSTPPRCAQSAISFARAMLTSR